MSSTIDRRNVGQETILILLPLDVAPAYINRLQGKYPGITIRWHNMRAADKLITINDIPKESFDNVSIICTQRLPNASLLPKCHYIQLSAAGPDKSASHDLYRDPKITVCAANGVHPPQIAEWVIGAWLAHQHHFPRYAAHQRNEYWPTDFERTLAVVEDSGDLRMGILGYGAIGRQCARLAKTLRMDVVAFTRTEKRTAEARRDDSFHLAGTGDPEGEIPSAWFHGSTEQDVNRFLEQDLDVLVLCLPLTGNSQKILGEAQFEILARKRTFVINIARGGLIDTDALIAALERGQISGAALDVTDPEPLPAGHRLWSAPNVFITPHVSFQTPHYYTRVLEILEQNLERLSTGTKLLNVVDKVAHY